MRRPPTGARHSVASMANSATKTEHSGAKNRGGGYWGPRADAKHWSNRARRVADRSEAAVQHAQELDRNG
jgi:hypothetical protein